MTPKEKLAAKIEAKERLLKVLKPGSCIYTVQYRSKGTYTRYIKIYTIEEDRPVHLCNDVSLALYERPQGERGGVKCQCEPSELVNYLAEGLFGRGDALKHYAL